MSKFVSNFGNDDEVSDDIYLARLRYWRDSELLATDWTQLSDSPVNKELWADYRQQLRDLPNKAVDLRKAELPKKPN